MAKKIYSNLAIASILMMLPFVVAAGVFAGYLVADGLGILFTVPGWLFLLIIVFGLLSGVFEAWRMLRLAIRLDKEGNIR